MFCFLYCFRFLGCKVFWVVRFMVAFSVSLLLSVALTVSLFFACLYVYFVIRCFHHVFVFRLKKNPLFYVFIFNVRLIFFSHVFVYLLVVMFKLPFILCSLFPYLQASVYAGHRVIDTLPLLF